MHNAHPSSAAGKVQQRERVANFRLMLEQNFREQWTLQFPNARGIGTGPVFFQVVGRDILLGLKTVGVAGMGGMGFKAGEPGLIYAIRDVFAWSFLNCLDQKCGGA
jgi:hypothetical protein